MATLLDEIGALLGAPTADRASVERTLTDGYAHALELEAERVRLQRRVAELTHGLQRGDAPEKAKELSSLAQQLDGNAGALSKLRGVLAELRRHSANLM